LRPALPPPARRPILLIALACLASVAQARDARISIPATTLDAALALLGRETGADVISTEPGLRGVRTVAVQGTMSVHAALDRLLKGSGYRAIAVDARSFRIVRAARAASTAPKAHAQAVPEDAPPADVLVTASKQHVSLLRYPGSLITIPGDGQLPSAATPDMSGVARTTPVLQTTELGPGRNKIFIRGIADSSFNGAAQSTASIYFGDVQLGYSGPDPSLKLYDMQSIDVMEGPQGTLYGSGSIGGIIRLTPNPVDLNAVGGAVTAGTTLTSKGTPGVDASAMLNVPIKSDVLGVRALAYRTRDGGYIDDPSRGLRDINRTDTVGARVALDVDPGDGWRIELGALDQWIDGQDSQYAQQGAGPLAQRSVLAQPFHNEVAQGRAVVTKNWDSGLQLLSATGYAGYDAREQFDATAPGPVGPSNPAVIYLTVETKSLLTHETRLSRSLPGGSSWVVGVTLLRDEDSQSRALGMPGNELDIIGVTNVTRSASVFGEATWAVTPSFSATLGGRVTFARTDGQPSVRPRSEDYVHGRSTRRLDPTAAFSWRLAPRLALFGRFQTGYRTGGIAVARGVGRVADFRPDSIVVGELGIRRLREGDTGLSLSASLSTAHWTEIQADLINRRGQPYTANIGDARIHAAEASADWVPIRGLRITASALYTRNRVTNTTDPVLNPANRRLPETPPFAGTAAMSYEWWVGAESVLHAGMTGSYFGRSVLGTGDLLDISQGRYAVVGLNGGWRWRQFETTLTVDNLTNARANRFAFGNPFTIAARDQVTPLRPFNVRLGFGVAW
jgi:outer membrane receptor protein involved in Fe transport